MKRKIFQFLIVTLCISWLVTPAFGIDDEVCLACHDDQDLVTEKDGQEVSRYVDGEAFTNSTHGDIGCNSCHADVEDVPHEEDLDKVECGLCHDDAADEFDANVHGLALRQGNQSAPACITCHGKHDTLPPADINIPQLCGGCHKAEVQLFEKSQHGQALLQGNPLAPTCITCHTGHQILAATDEKSSVHALNIPPLCAQCHEDTSQQFNNSLHGQALQQGNYLAPNCMTCHQQHNILPPANEASSTYVMNIPAMCGQCHKEGTAVSELEGVDEERVLEDYSQSIHGDGLFKRGLIVSAVCTNCHTSHNILSHENPDSSIHRDNIAQTCIQCHRQIEKVHIKVIRSELWEKKPHEIPACIDCHAPHIIRQVFYEEEVFSDKACMSCHNDEKLYKEVDGEKVSLYVNADDISHSVHNENSCIKCHTNVSIVRDPVCLNSGTVDCSMCHAEQVEDYQISYHSQSRAQGNQNAPYCTDCHGDHAIQSKTDVRSPIFIRNIPELCGRCHQKGQEEAIAYQGHEHDVLEKYTMSIHGKALYESGLMVTAVCVDCHTAHRELPGEDPNSTVHKKNVATTCAQCHLGIFETLRNSIHSPMVSGEDKKLPVCNDCHSSHTIKRVDIDNFRQNILDQCGDCHQDQTDTYFETFHGKVSKLGLAKTAKCHDCHGAHNVLPAANPNSTLNRSNIVGTCKACHPNSNRKFTGYLTHATHHNRKKYPILYFTFWFMTSILIGTFIFFGLHTLLWIPKALKATRKFRKKVPSHEKEQYYERFDGFSRVLHVLVIIGFLSLATTGMIIKFSGVGIFQTLSNLLGGYVVTGFVHRFAALITFTYFSLHIGYLIHKKITQKLSLKEMLTGERTLMFRMRDLVEFGQTMKWFLGAGPRPQYGRFTYWEKFTYFAEFWGVIIIGSSGLFLWFPEFFTGTLRAPGWLINVATIIHSDEALLAAGFIFTIHFFNTHFRPDKFPMDLVIFTGRVSVDKLKEDRPREYEALVNTPEFEKKLKGAPSPTLTAISKIFGFIALFIGIVAIMFIIYAMIFLYQ